MRHLMLGGSGGKWKGQGVQPITIRDHVSDVQQLDGPTGGAHRKMPLKLDPGINI